MLFWWEGRIGRIMQQMNFTSGTGLNEDVRTVLMQLLATTIWIISNCLWQFFRRTRRNDSHCFNYLMMITEIKFQIIPFSASVSILSRTQAFECHPQLLAINVLETCFHYFSCLLRSGNFAACFHENAQDVNEVYKLLSSRKMCLIEARKFWHLYSCWEFN